MVLLLAPYAAEVLFDCLVVLFATFAEENEMCLDEFEVLIEVGKKIHYLLLATDGQSLCKADLALHADGNIDNSLLYA